MAHRGAAALIATQLTGCTGPLSALDPAGPGASPVAAVWWVMFWGSMGILAFVVMLSLYAALSSPERRLRAPTRLLVIGGGVAFPFAVITALLIYGMRSGHALLPLPVDQRVFRVEITAHQWWWEVRYPDTDGVTLYDANEAHIPVDQPVDLRITTNDVIHSFWIPRLGGKMDAIPGLTNILRLEASVPGIYRGQCSEFCGAQHARMGFHVVAHEQSELQARLEALANRSQPIEEDPPPPGADAFMTHCAECHSADARVPHVRVGPNLAGLPDRQYLAAGWLENTPDNLRQWIRHNSRIKPGNQMPDFAELDDETIEAIASYLEQVR